MSTLGKPCSSWHSNSTSIRRNLGFLNTWIIPGIEHKPETPTCTVNDSENDYGSMSKRRGRWSDVGRAGDAPTVLVLRIQASPVGLHKPSFRTLKPDTGASEWKIAGTTSGKSLCWQKRKGQPRRMKHERNFLTVDVTDSNSLGPVSITSIQFLNVSGHT